MGFHVNSHTNAVPVRGPTRMLASWTTNPTRTNYPMLHFSAASRRQVHISNLENLRFDDIMGVAHRLTGTSSVGLLAASCFLDGSSIFFCLHFVAAARSPFSEENKKREEMLIYCRINQYVASWFQTS